MRPASFVFIRAADRSEVLDALARYGDAAILLAGGQSLVPMMNMRIARPGVVVDLNHCADLAGLREESGAVVAGAMLRQAHAEREPLLRARCPLMLAALPWVGYPSNRTRGTLGGSFAQADPTAELPGVAVALDAVFVIDGPAGTREVAARQFFIAPLTTAIAPGELLREILFPVAPPGARVAFCESGNRHHDLAIAGIAAQIVVDAHGRCSDARLAAIGAGERPQRLDAAEAEINGSILDPATLTHAAQAAIAEVEARGDTVASSDYRRKLVAALTARALGAIADKVSGSHD